MPYIPHTQDDITAMLERIGVQNIEALFDEIPSELRCNRLERLPSALTEIEITRLLQKRVAQDKSLTCFVGAGAYEHHIPAAVWEIAARGEFYSAYTPYQAEASQGTLQLLYEFQTMMANLTHMEVSNASLYDGASALAEAVLMAVRLSKKEIKRILIPTTLHPIYRRVVNTIVHNQGITLVDVPYSVETGTVALETLEKFAQVPFAAFVIPQPNFFGHLELVDELTDWAHTHHALAIAVVNPLSLSILKPPGNWGQQGADIVSGEAQPLGIPLSSGGPYLGFMCCKKTYVRQLPGRIVGRTTDLKGDIGYTLTLQAREQHIRRAKATSNICTNQGLMVTAATIYLSLMGAAGLERTAWACHANTKSLAERLSLISGVAPVFNTPYFHETVIHLPISPDSVLQTLAEQHILGGYSLEAFYPELGNALLICATEMRTMEEIEEYGKQLHLALKTAMA